MLPKKYKLKSNSEITRVFKNGKTVKSSFLFLRYRPNKLEETKAAFSIGLKYSKRAVDRNQAKRVLRQAMNELTPQIKPGFDLVFYFDKSFQGKTELEATQANMRACLSSASLLR